MNKKIAKEVLVFLPAVFLMACTSTAGVPTATLLPPTLPITETQPVEPTELDALSLNLTEFASLPTSTVTSTVSPFKQLSIAGTPQGADAFDDLLPHHIVAPNGQWAVVDSGGFFILHSSGEVIWELPKDLREKLEIETGGIFVADQWSPDSRTLFFTYAIYVDLAIVSGNGSGYWQLDIVDGTIKEILPIRLESADRALALSPSQKMLVYIEHGNPLQITFHEIETRAERTYPVPGEYYSFGNITWAGNEDFVFYVVGITTHPAENGSQFALIMFDVNQETQSVIFERIDIPIYLDWFDENTLEISGGAEDELLFFDLLSREFVDK